MGQAMSETRLLTARDKVIKVKRSELPVHYVQKV